MTPEQRPSQEPFSIISIRWVDYILSTLSKEESIQRFKEYIKNSHKLGIPGKYTYEQLLFGIDNAIRFTDSQYVTRDGELRKMFEAIIEKWS